MHVATDPQQMSDTCWSVGMTGSRHSAVTWSMKMSGSRGLYQVAIVPVLVITRSEPQGVIQELIACLQK